MSVAFVKKLNSTSQWLINKCPRIGESIIAQVWSRTSIPCIVICRVALLKNMIAILKIMSGCTSKLNSTSPHGFCSIRQPEARRFPAIFFTGRAYRIYLEAGMDRIQWHYMRRPFSLNFGVKLGLNLFSNVVLSVSPHQFVAIFVESFFDTALLLFWNSDCGLVQVLEKEISSFLQALTLVRFHCSVFSPRVSCSHIAY